ncbi:RPC3 polymerase, partial [Vidua macroura]|nr:RPC3 polymerase [Vidua macroura]
MTQAELRLCSLLLRENFGEIVEKVGNSLLRTGPRPLRLLVGDTGLLPDQVKKALCVLLQHGLARYEPQPRGAVEYEARGERVLRILRYPRYIYTAKTLYGDPGELLVEELLLHGHLPMSSAVARVADRLTETMEDGKSMDFSEVSATFVRLADTHFIHCVPPHPQSHPTCSSSSSAPPMARAAPGPAAGAHAKDRFVVPRLGLVGSFSPFLALYSHFLSFFPQPPPDDGIYWQVNLERFHQHFRDQALVSAVASRMDQVCAALLASLIPHSTLIPAFPPSFLLFPSLPAGYNISRAVLDQYLALLADDPVRFPGFGIKILILCSPPGAAPSPSPRPSLTPLPLPRFGSRCARIFRLLLRKKHLEQKQVEDFAMIPAKEAKDMLYRMLSENLVALQ